MRRPYRRTFLAGALLAASCAGEGGVVDGGPGTGGGTATAGQSGSGTGGTAAATGGAVGVAGGAGSLGGAGGGNGSGTAGTGDGAGADARGGNGGDAAGRGGSDGRGGSGGSASGAGGAGASAGRGGGGGTGASAGTGGNAGTTGAAGSAGTAGGGGNAAFPFRPAYILGADISWTLEDEARGQKYVEGGVTKSIERIFANNGFNFIRLRTFVNPSYRCSGTCASGESNGYNSQGFCDTTHTIAIATRVKACKMGVFLDFHMSDTWASIGVQYKPQSWEGLSQSQLQQTAYNYVKDTLAQMVAAGVKPDMVQIGNETNSSMSETSMSNWANFSGLVNAGIRAVRDTDPKIIVWAQHGRPRPDGNFEPWVDDYLTNSPPIDVDGICGSTYGTTNNGDDWRMEFGYVISKYAKPVMSCEYTDERRTLINPIMRALPNQMGRGSFLWEPTRYPDYNSHTLFDHSGSTFTANATMTAYADLARSYGLPVPSTSAAALDTTTCR